MSAFVIDDENTNALSGSGCGHGDVNVQHLKIELEDRADLPATSFYPNNAAGQ
jgi:hypothetical protein